ncbi:MAG TPA: flagellar motor protein MotB [Fibrobacteraceae bacterium]|nr:flagellar motor protein MotB [Fibrobacteraceae bacterium]
MSLNAQHNRYRSNEGADSFGMDDWLGTYADIVTLLLSFFVLMMGISRVDPTLWEAMKSGLRSEISGEKEVKTPLAEIKHDLDSLLASERAQKTVRIDLGREGIVMQFSSSAFYDAGSADVGPQARNIIDRVVQAMQDIDYYPFKIDIEGHTDNSPIHTMRFPSNWELSVARATNIVRYMLEKGVQPDRLKAAGYADTKPILPNQDSLGRDIPTNQAMNRRIVVRIH